MVVALVRRIIRRVIRRSIRRGWITALCLGMLFGTTAQATKANKPAESSCHAPYPLTGTTQKLQNSLEKRIRKMGWGRHLDRKTLSVSIVDLTDNNRIYYAGLNDDRMMYAASLPKIAILLSVIEQANEGELEWSHKIDTRLSKMVTASSNSDAAWAAELVGLENIADILQQPKYCFYEKPLGGLWVGRTYRGGGPSNRDPVFNISHGATSRQTARFYTMLFKGKLVSRHWSFRMLGLMAPPKHYHKFVGGLKDREGVVFLARKSGTWRNFHADSALIQHFGRRYVLVALTEVKSGEGMMREIAKIADDLIMDGAHRPKKKSRKKKRRK